MIEEIFLGLFGIGFSVFFLGALLFGLVDLLGKIYVTYSSIVREDLTQEQKLIYIAIAWFIPLGWIIYILLDKEKSADLFSEVDFL